MIPFIDIYKIVKKLLYNKSSDINDDKTKKLFCLTLKEVNLVLNYYYFQ